MPGNSQYLEWEFEKLKKAAEKFVSSDVNPVTGGIKESSGSLMVAGSLLAASTLAKIGRIPLRVTGIGNSIMASSYSWMLQMCDNSNGMFVAADKGKGVSGDNTAAMVARMATVTTAAHIVFIMEGTNDGAGLVSNAAHIANMRTMIEYYLARGQLPVLCRPPTRNDGQTSYMNRAYQLGMCDYFLAQEYGIPCLDPWRGFINPADGTLASSAESSDNLHPGASAHYAAGVESFKQLIGQSTTVPLPVAHTTFGGTGLVSNPIFYSAGWGTSGSGATSSLVSDSSAVGQWQRLTGNGAGSFVASLQVGSANFLAGDELLFVAKLRGGAKSAGSTQFATLQAPSYTDCGPSRTFDGAIDSVVSGYGVVATGATSVNISLTLSGATSGRTSDIAQVQVYNKTAIMTR